MIEENRKSEYEKLQEISTIRVLSEVPKRNNREVLRAERQVLQYMANKEKRISVQQRRNAMTQKRLKELS